MKDKCSYCGKGRKSLSSGISVIYHFLYNDTEFFCNSSCLNSWINNKKD